MSEPTYRIETSIDPHGDEPIKWQAVIFRESDGIALHCEVGPTSEAATGKARRWIRIEHHRSGAAWITYTDETGDECAPPVSPEPQSLRA